MHDKTPEVWKDCPICGHKIEISSFGRFRYKSGFHPRNSRGIDPKTGYIRTRLKAKNSNSVVVSIDGNHICVSWLVATAFIPNPSHEKRAYHLDGDLSNNCVSNLSWKSKYQLSKKPPRKFKEKTDYESLLSIWGSIGTRCNNPKHFDYRYYGGRGIKRCDEWKHFKNFYAWAVSSGYRQGLQIDRIDNRSDYSPKNCRWVTRKENGRNKRNNHHITINGKTYTISELAEMAGISWHAAYHRVQRGWNPEELTSKWGYRGNVNTISGDFKNKKTKGK